MTSLLKASINRLPSILRRNWFSFGYRSALDRGRLVRDTLHPTFVKQTPFDSTKILRCFTLPPLSVLKPHSSWIACVSRLYLSHCFDLLGSGWVNVRYGMDCQGLEEFRYSPEVRDTQSIDTRINQKNLPNSRRILETIGSDYQPIDWQRDFISGYRWKEKTWSKRVRYGDRSGADIKVPWELARMQHIPTLVYAHALASAGEEDFSAPETYSLEFQNQVLDFIANNPPRFGANWVCAMDVAIRAANWLAAYDLFRASGAEFPERFTREFIRSIYEHGHHIATHLEWNPGLRGNHYLTNIAGLIFIAAYLPGKDETNRWLAFGIQEFLDEFQLQFQEDGTNFEASTCYHRLSGEIALYTVALIAGLSPEKFDVLNGAYFRNDSPTHPAFQFRDLPFYPFPGHPQKETPLPPWVFERLNGIAEFTAAMTTPDGSVPQIGDNDNGRFFKFHPVFDFPNVQPECPTENVLDHRHLVAACNAILNRQDMTELAGDGWIDYHIIKGLAGNFHVREETTPASKPMTLTDSPFNILENLTYYEYKDFGLYLFRSSSLYLLFRCGSIGQNGNGGHAHNDQLSFVLSLFSIPVFIDPGTYLYTPIPGKRNLFRSTAAHNTLAVQGREQHPWPDPKRGLFQLLGGSAPAVLETRKHGITAVHHGFDVPHQRALDIHSTGLTGIDECREPDKIISFHLAPGLRAELTNDGIVCIPLTDSPYTLTLSSGHGVWSIQGSSYSAAYGRIQETETIRLQSASERIEWEIGIQR